MRNQFIMIVLLSSLPLPTRAQTCDAQRAEFSRLSTPLIFQSESDWKRFDKKQYDANTEAAHKYIENQILKQLKSRKTDARSLERFIRCVQSLPAYQSFRDETNAPAAFTLNQDPEAIVLVYYLYRGGNAIPDTLPYVEVFLREATGVWTSSGMAATSFEKSTFFVYELSSPTEGQHWFLLSGFEIGDTGARLRLQVVAFDGAGMRTIWTKSGLAHTTLAEVHPKFVVLSEYKGYKGGHDLFQKHRLDVAPGGLREHNDGDS